jgi:hypothetical protein
MNLIALYVYSPTTFTTDKPIEAMSGALEKSGEVELQPGVYRINADANLVPAPGTSASAFEVVAASGGTKGGWPDPPARVVTLLSTSTTEIHTFLTGAGQADELG